MFSSPSSTRKSLLLWGRRHWHKLNFPTLRTGPGAGSSLFPVIVMHTSSDHILLSLPLAWSSTCAASREQSPSFISSAHAQPGKQSTQQMFENKWGRASLHSGREHGSHPNNKKKMPDTLKKKIITFFWAHQRGEARTKEVNIIPKSDKPLRGKTRLTGDSPLAEVGEHVATLKSR